MPCFPTCSWLFFPYSQELWAQGLLQLSCVACPAPLGSPQPLPSFLLPSLLQDAEGLGGDGARLQRGHSAADRGPANPEEGGQGLPAALSPWLPRGTLADQDTQEMEPVAEAMEKPSSEEEIDTMFPVYHQGKLGGSRPFGRQLTHPFTYAQ